MNAAVRARFRETPYWYIKNYFQYYTSAVGPTQPNGILNDIIQSDGDSEFFARMAWLSYNFQDNNQAYFISSPSPLQAVPPAAQLAIAPEKYYPLGGGIPIQVLVEGNQFVGPGVWLTYAGGTTAYVNLVSVGFQGVKRWKGQANDTPPYRYREKEFNYTSSFVQNWTYLNPPYTSFNVAPFRTFSQVVNDFDFELWALEISSDYWNQSETSYPGYMIRLYDANGIALMKDFVHFRYLSYLTGFAGSANVPGENLQYVPNCFPCPPVLYPVGSIIKYDILSLLDTTGAAPGPSATQYINFRGVRRIPC